MKLIDADALWKDITTRIEEYCDIADLMDIIERQPAIEPEPHWIPVTERLPDDDTLMLVNYIDHRPDAMDIWIGWHEMENVWYIDGEEHSRERGNEVIAWMPLPEPWKGEQHA